MLTLLGWQARRSLAVCVKVNLALRFSFSVDAAVPDLGLVPCVMMAKDCIQNFFGVGGNIGECLRWLSVF